MLHPGEVGVAHRRDAMLPPLVVTQPVAAPVGDVEGRIGEDVVGAQVRVTVVLEAVSMLDSGPQCPESPRFILAMRQVV